jgi:hypothetical protein
MMFLSIQPAAVPSAFQTSEFNMCYQMCPRISQRFHCYRGFFILSFFVLAHIFFSANLCCLSLEETPIMLDALN